MRPLEDLLTLPIFKPFLSAPASFMAGETHGSFYCDCDSRCFALTHDDTRASSSQLADVKEKRTTIPESPRNG